MSKQPTAYVLYSAHCDDFIMYAVFTSKEELDAYIEKHIPEADRYFYYSEKLPLNPKGGAVLCKSS